ncbi:MAG: BatD family protein, partial [Kiritimatiellales bacterium]
MKILDFRVPIVFCLMALHAFGFEATMTIQPPLIQLGETATLSVEVRGAKNISPPALPNVPGLRFSGASQSQQTSWVNGKTDSSTSFSFQIAPQQTGTFKIGPFEYKVDGQTKTLQGELKVVGTSGDAAQPQSWNDIIFARLVVDRESTYVQEPFGMMLSIYSRQGVQMANINLQG